MDSTYYQIEFDLKSRSDADVLIALLGELPFEGFDESGEDRLLACISASGFDESALKEALQPISECTYRISVVKTENWNSRWESEFQPVLVDDFVSVRAHFHPMQAGVEHELLITPKMSFGTGHHATTVSMMRLMRSIDFRGKRVFDFGTGTGILAILAEKMGAVLVDAMDNDDWSVLNTEENVRNNQCRIVRVMQGEEVPDAGGYDVVLANINLNVILAQLPRIVAAVKPGGKILLSGFLVSDGEKMITELDRHNLTLAQDVTCSGWLALTCAK